MHCNSSNDTFAVLVELIKISSLLVSNILDVKNYADGKDGDNTIDILTTRAFSMPLTVTDHAHKPLRGNLSLGDLPVLSFYSLLFMKLYSNNFDTKIADTLKKFKTSL